MARIFIVSINYAPEPTGFAPMATSLAEQLARRGHEIHVFTGFPYAPDWKRREEDRGRLFARERVGGVTVYRLTHFIPRRPSSFVQRALMEGSLSAAGLAAMTATMLSRTGRPDAVLYIGAQPALAMLARVVAKLASCPYFVNVTDLAARAALDVGIVGARISRVLEILEFAAYRKAAAAFVLCRSFEKTLIAHGYPAARIHVIPVPTDIERIRPVPSDGAFRARYGISASAFVVMHAGSMGLKQGLMNVVAAAALTRDSRICWVLVGTGEARAELIDEARRLALDDSVRFVPFQPNDTMSEMFAAADVLLLNQVRAVKDTVIPSKLLTYMASGRPVLAAVNPESEAAQLLREATGGVLVAPDDPDALATAARWCTSADRSVLDGFGTRNRTYAEEYFDERKILALHEQILMENIP